MRYTIMCSRGVSVDIGALFWYFSSITKGKRASDHYACIQFIQPTIEETPQNRSRKPKGNISSIEFEKVQFSYLTWPNTTVLNEVDLKIKQGEFLALMGASGSGKSTKAAMLERFYDPTAGTINIDSDPLTSPNPPAYGNRIALVQQEPTLDPRSTGNNALLVLEDTDTDAHLSGPDLHLPRGWCSGGAAGGGEHT